MNFLIAISIWLLFGMILGSVLFFISHKISDKKIYIPIYFLVIFLYFSSISGFDLYKRDIDSKKIVERKKLTIVSSSPPINGVSGSIGGFLLITGSIESKPYYILREKIEDGVYKDFTVKKEVYIKEVDDLVNIGYFKQYSECTSTSDHIDFFGYHFNERKNYRCAYKKQVIEVPKGAVIKNISI